jgi:aromatic ring-opening dioxygenase catalytic subunit (LigB family)
MDTTSDPNHEHATQNPSARMPVVFLSHGGGPWPFIDQPYGSLAELEALANYLRGVPKVPPAPPKALLMISAHWEEHVPTVMSGTNPPMLYDYTGFEAKAYEVTWPAPGDPQLAARVRQLLAAAGFQTAENDRRGFDHGTFVPLKLAYPEADVPTIQLSLTRDLDPAKHIALGRALQPLRDEGVFIVGSGMTYHNMPGFGKPLGAAQSKVFDAWLQAKVTSSQAEREAALTDWTSAPFAREVHPREEHLLPLMVIAGAAGDDAARVGFCGTGMGITLSTYHFG